MTLAVNVAARVVGLTDSRLGGMDQRLDAFFGEGVGEFKRTPKGVFNFLRGQSNVLAFLYLDVKPAIAARKRSPRKMSSATWCSRDATTGRSSPNASSTGRRVW